MGSEAPGNGEMRTLIDGALSYAHKVGQAPAELVERVLLDPVNRDAMLANLGLEQVGWYARHSQGVHLTLTPFSVGEASRVQVPVYAVTTSGRPT